MRKFFLLLASALFSLALQGSSPPSARTGFSKMFCPDSWKYLTGPGSIDMKGNCAVCGRYPVELEVALRSWFWCSRQTLWLDSPCAESAREACCSPVENLALLAAPGTEMTSSWYCPFDQAFAAFSPWRMPPACSLCGRAAVRAAAVNRAWFWCELEGMWGTEPCPMSAVKKCCTKYEGMLLAKPDAGPIADSRR